MGYEYFKQKNMKKIKNCFVNLKELTKSVLGKGFFPSIKGHFC